MKSRKPLVAGNWKMNGDVVANEHLFTTLRSALERTSTSRIDIVVCPPFPYLGQAIAWLSDTGIAVGGQNVAAADQGAFTGEVSAGMLADLGCRWAIVGHSERRTLFGETDEVVAAKTHTALAQGIGVIVCVGESLEERERGLTEAVLARQVDAFAAALAGPGRERVVVAYEPVWAIGTGRSASNDMAQQAHRFIRDRLALQDSEAAEQVRILYGGSVKPSNAIGLFSMPDIDGGLIGGASLVADDFLNICRAAAAA